MEWLEVGCKDINLMVAYNILTTVTLDLQVEKALCLPSTWVHSEEDDEDEQVQDKDDQKKENKIKRWK